MNARTLLDNFDLLAEAPGGVPKLRELILQLAVRGKLMPQEAGTKKGEIHHEEHEEKKEGESIEDPYAVPMGWRWTTLRSVSSDLGQRVPDARFTYVDVSAIDKERERIGDAVQVLRPEEAPSRARKIVKQGTVIYSTVRPYLLNIAVVDREFDPTPIVSTAFFVMHPHPEVDARFLFYYLRSQPFTTYVNGAMTGMAYPAVNDAKMSAGPFPLPPLAEQKRIVARVDELIKRCDELEARQKERESRAADLARASLVRFSDAPTPSNLTLLFHPSFSIAPADLRKAILTLAVQGKLVPRKAESPRGTLQSILAEASVNGVSKGPTSNSSATEILRISAGTSQGDFYVNESDVKHVDLPPDEVEKYRLVPGDLLACRFNGNLHYVGRFSYYRGKSARVQVNPDKLIRFRVDTATHCPRYVCYAMNAGPTRKEIEAMCATTAGNIGLSAGRRKTVEIPLPPLAEQRRIVAKVDELMALADQLETQLAASRAIATDLLDAIVTELMTRE